MPLSYEQKISLTKINFQSKYEKLGSAVISVWENENYFPIFNRYGVDILIKGGIKTFVSTQNGGCCILGAALVSLNNTNYSFDGNIFNLLNQQFLISHDELIEIRNSFDDLEFYSFSKDAKQFGKSFRQAIISGTNEKFNG